MTPHYTYCEALVRAQDKDRFLASLYAPASHRPHLFALYAFAYEIARVREVVSDPMPGEVRLQWWRDVLVGCGQGECQSNPVAAAICDTIQKFCLPLETFQNMIDARVFDLYDDPMPTLNDLEGYAGETSSAIIHLAAVILNDGKPLECADLAGHSGCAWTIIGILRALPLHRRRGQVYIPADLSAQHSLTAQDVLNGDAKIIPTLIALMDRAEWHLDQVRYERQKLCTQLSPAFLYVCLARHYLKKMRKTPERLIDKGVEIHPILRPWLMCRAAGRVSASPHPRA